MAEQRSEFLIKRKFQKTMILEVLLITFIMINLVVCAGYLLIDSISDVHDLKQYLALTIAAMEIVGFYIVYQYNVKSSHRIAGPVYKFEQSLKSIESGDLGFSLRLRENDKFQEVSEQMNATVTTLRQRIERAQALAGDLQRQHGVDKDLVDELVRELGYFSIEQPDAASRAKR